MINDPEVINEFYVSLNKFVDKHPKQYRVFKTVIGESILFNSSNEMWALKRKHLSAAFYKDKLNKMLALIIRNANHYIRQLLENNARTGKPVDISALVQEMVMTSILICVFGMKMEDLGELPYRKGGAEQMMHPGLFLRNLIT